MSPLFILEGKVEKGKSRGKSLGFPTINFPLTQNIPEGIYVSQIEVDGQIHNALTFIGAAKTFGESKLQAETYILGFEKDVYGEKVSVSLLKKIRDNMRFNSEKELIEQMKKDEEDAIEYFKNNKA